MHYDHSKPFTPIGYTNWRNQNQLFGIRLQDRFSHIYAIGKTGVGKTTLLLNMAIDDVYKGYGVCLIEPHGDACLKLLEQIPEDRKKDIVYFDATNLAHPTGLNPLHGVPADQRHLVASELVLAFKKIWQDSWGPRLEYILRYCLLTLLEYPTATLLDITPLLLDQRYRNIILQFTDDPSILSFWINEFARYPASLRADAIMPILNKAGVFNSNKVLRGIVGREQGIDIEEIMNSGKILVCNLSKGIIGEDVSQILGSLITTGIQTAAMRRAMIQESERSPYMVFIDECHSFITNSFANMLSEVRKYKIGLFLTHQYLEQLPEDVRSGVLGNVGTTICFRLSAKDGETMEHEFYPVCNRQDFVTIGRFNVYVKLLIDGMASRPFSAKISTI
jgi:DNA helicase HerA-like ATPase